MTHRPDNSEATFDGRSEAHEPPPPGSDREWAAIERRLLGANDSIEPPADLVDRIETCLRVQESRQARLWTKSLAIAAALLLTAGAALVVRHVVSTPDGPAGPEFVHEGIGETGVAPAPLPAPVDPRRHVNVELDPASALFTRVVETERPNVSIILIYESVNVVEVASNGNDPGAKAPTT